MKHRFPVLIEQDEDGMYIASVPSLKGCHTQARSLDALQEGIQEAIELYLEEAPDQTVPRSQFIGVHIVEIER